MPLKAGPIREHFPHLQENTMAYITVKVFDAADSRMEENAQHIQKAMGGLMEFDGCGNDSYHDWCVDDPEGNGGGYVTEKEQACVNTWLKANGAEPGENILISYGC